MIKKTVILLGVCAVIGSYSATTSARWSGIVDLFNQAAKHPQVITPKFNRAAPNPEPITPKFNDASGANSGSGTYGTPFPNPKPASEIIPTPNAAPTVKTPNIKPPDIVI